jgi:putative transposase
MDYIHFNPVKHGLVSDVTAWPYSSFHRSVAVGLYPSGWVTNEDWSGDWGERESDFRQVAVD